MTDLEMLELLEKAKEKNTGPRVSRGLESLASISTTTIPSPLGLVMAVSKSDLPTPQDGAVGEQDLQENEALRDLQDAQVEMVIRPRTPGVRGI